MDPLNSSKQRGPKERSFMLLTTETKAFFFPFQITLCVSSVHLAESSKENKKIKKKALGMYWHERTRQSVFGNYFFTILVSLCQYSVKESLLLTISSGGGGCSLSFFVQNWKVLKKINKRSKLNEHISLWITHNRWLLLPFSQRGGLCLTVSFEGVRGSNWQQRRSCFEALCETLERGTQRNEIYDTEL